MFAKLRRHVRRFDSLADMLVDGTLYTGNCCRTSDILTMMVSPGSGATGSRLPHDTISQARNRMVAFVEELLEAARPDGTARPEVMPQHAAEWLLHIIGSLVSASSPWLNNSDAQRYFLRSVVVPAFMPDAALVLASTPSDAGTIRLGQPASLTAS